MDYNRWLTLVRQSGADPNLADHSWLAQQYQFGTAPTDIAKAIQAGTYRPAARVSPMVPAAAPAAHTSPAAISGSTVIGCFTALLIFVGLIVVAYAWQQGQANQGKASIARVKGLFCFARESREEDSSGHVFVLVDIKEDGKVVMTKGIEHPRFIEWSDSSQTSGTLDYEGSDRPYVYLGDPSSYQVKFEFTRDPYNSNQIIVRLTELNSRDQDATEQVFERMHHLPTSYDDYRQQADLASQTVESQPMK